MSKRKPHSAGESKASELDKVTWPQKSSYSFDEAAALMLDHCASCLRDDFNKHITLVCNTLRDFLEDVEKTTLVKRGYRPDLCRERCVDPLV